MGIIEEIYRAAREVTPVELADAKGLWNFGAIHILTSGRRRSTHTCMAWKVGGPIRHRKSKPTRSGGASR